VPAVDRADVCAGESADGCGLSVDQSAHAVEAGYRGNTGFLGEVQRLICESTTRVGIVWARCQSPGKHASVANEKQAYKFDKTRRRHRVLRTPTHRTKTKTSDGWGTVSPWFGEAGGGLERNRESIGPGFERLA
jgi:hypothetical protein